MGKVVKFCVTIFLIVYITMNNINKINAEESNMLLVDTILKNKINNYNDIVEDGLYYIEKNNDKIYFYAGENINNNILLNGLKYNILGIDINGNIKIMLDEDNVFATTINYMEVLNNWYQENIIKNNISNIVVKTEICDNMNNSLYCENTEKVDVALLTLQEFKHSKINNNTFLNKQHNYYLWTTYYNHKYYYNSIENKIKTTKKEEFNLYPVITLSSKTIISSGDGLETTPWIIANTIYGNSENVNRSNKIIKLDEPKILKKDDLDLFANSNNLDSVIYEIYNNEKFVYSIEFVREKFKSVQEFNLAIYINEIENEIFDNIKYTIKDREYISFYFENENEFPNSAITKINVAEKFDDHSTLWLYYYNEDEKLEYYDNNLVVEDEYITMNINKGGQYILTDKEIKTLNTDNNFSKYILISSGILLVFCMLIILIIKKYKKYK